MCWREGCGAKEQEEAVETAVEMSKPSGLTHFAIVICLVVYCKPSEEDTIVLKANGNKSIEVKSKSKSIIVV